jgi:HK97 family phage major capsid protein
MYRSTTKGIEMSKSIQALREQKQALSKEANNLLANNGDKIWSKDDQSKFDGLGDQIELVNNQIEAHQKMLDAAADDFADASKKPAAGKKSEAVMALDIFLRKQSKHISVEEHAMIQNTMSTTTGSEGGYTVQPEIGSIVIEALKDFGAMRRVAEQISTSQGNDLSYPTSDGTSEEGEIVAQNTEAADDDIDFGTVGLNVFKFGSKVVTVPIELLQDSNIDVQALVFKRLRERIGRIQNRMFTVGTGVAQPTGIVTAAGVGKVGAAGQVATVLYDDLVDLVDSMDVAYLDGQDPLFMFTQTMRRVIRKIKDTAGRPIWTPGYEAGMTAATPDLLLGYKIEINNNVATPAASAKSIVFGALEKYMIRDALDITLFKFDDSAFVKKGQIGFMGWARSGGNLLDVNGVKVYQHPAA